MASNIAHFPNLGESQCSLSYDKPLLAPGEYLLALVSYETVHQFKTAKLALHFRVLTPGPGFGELVTRYYNVGSVIGKGRRKNGRFTVGRCSAYFREYCAVFGRSARIGRPSPARYRKCIVVGEVGTVIRGHDQADIPEGAQYSVVRRLVRLEEGDR
jgi:hypothetical protein